MNYNEAVDFIHSTKKLGNKLGLENIKRLMDTLGNPQDKLKFVHIAGTNGKGSTAAFISSILIEAGYKTGIFTSPYIQRFNERIRINNNDIENDDLAKTTALVKENIENLVAEGNAHPTEFEIVTAIALKYFYDKNCDIVVFEVGLGGRLDSTNVIQTPELSIITTISYDHMEYLGETLQEIAFEKAGIIKPNGDVLVYPQEDSVKKVFEDISLERNAKLHKADFSTIRPISHSLDGQVFDFEKYKNLQIKLLGNNQLKNASMAIKAAELLASKGFKINEEKIRQGLLKAEWAGRFEVLCKKPVLVIDGAHNVQGIEAFVENIETYFLKQKITFVAGVLADKNYKEMFEKVIHLAKKFLTITPDNPRALSAEDLKSFLNNYIEDVQAFESIEEAINNAIKNIDDNDVICVFGSLYFIGEVRDFKFCE